MVQTSIVLSQNIFFSFYRVITRENKRGRLPIWNDREYLNLQQGPL